MIALTADKGVAMVVMDRKDDINKSNNLLAQPAYKPIPKDPTNKKGQTNHYITKG